MKRFTVGEAKTAMRAGFSGEPSLLNKEILGVTIDSRKVEPGFLYVPIKGERFDGHDFIPAAYAAGAVCAVSERPVEGVPCLLVENSLLAYQALAEYYKSLFAAKTVGITGSVGKTTTKELVAAVLGQEFCVLKNEGNFNNQTGVPQTIFRLEETHTAAVIEMGMSHFGEIAALAKIVRPDVCLITNIGTAHIENLGSQEGILKAKCEMLPFMKQGGRVFVNGDDPYLARVKRERGDVTTFGFGRENDYFAGKFRDLGLEGSAFTAYFEGESLPLRVPAPGRHMVDNALAALAVGRAMGVPLKKIARGIAEYRPVSGRMCIEKNGEITVLNDVYNANPVSMKAAIDVLCKAKGRKVCVLGDMLELGDRAAEFHREIGEYAAQKGVDVMLFVGGLAGYMADGAGSKAVSFKTQEDLLKELPGLVRPGDTVLVKASRGMHLEHTVEALLKKE